MVAEWSLPDSWAESRLCFCNGSRRRIYHSVANIKESTGDVYFQNSLSLATQSLGGDGFWCWKSFVRKSAKKRQNLLQRFLSDSSHCSEKSQQQIKHESKMKEGSRGGTHSFGSARNGRRRAMSPLTQNPEDHSLRFPRSSSEMKWQRTDTSSSRISRVIVRGIKLALFKTEKTP